MGLNFEDELCRGTNRHCVTPAYRILKFMDQSADPCEDFYKASFIIINKLDDGLKRLKAKDI